MNSNKLLLTLILSILHFLGNAQTFKSYLKDFQNGYSDIENVKMTLEITAYSDSLKSDIIHESEVNLNKKKDEYHYYYGNVEIIATESLYLMINHYNRYVQVKTRNKEFEEQYISDLTKLDFDSIFKNINEPKLLEENNERVHYQLIMKDNELNQIDFFINKTKNHIQKISYYFKSGQAVEINFIEYTENPEFEPDFPHLNKYLEIIDGQAFLKDDYSNYLLVK